MIEDEHSSTDIRTRRAFGSHIKQFTVNQEQSCHGKGLRAVTLSPFWRLTISVNDEPEALMVLPPMSDSEQDALSDKFFLLRARKADMPMATYEHGEREAFWATLIAELPAFRYFLSQWKISEGLRDGRFGIKTWHHPALLAALDELAPETRLLALIDEVIFGGCRVEGLTIFRTGPWEGTAEQLESRLFSQDSGFAFEARKLLSWSTATGTYLGRLARGRPERVEHARTAASRNWLITRPNEVPKEQAEPPMRQVA